MRTALLLLLLVAACRAPYDRRVARFRGHYERGEFEAADEAIDRVIAKEAKSKRGALEVDPGRRDTYLLLLEKAMAQLALAWCLQNPHVSTVLTGASRVEQLRENLQALKFVDVFTPEVMAEVDRIFGADQT